MRTEQKRGPRPPFRLAQTGRQPSSSYRIRRLGTSALIFVASPHYIERHGMLDTPDDAGRHAFILTRSETGAETWSVEGPRGRAELAVSGRLKVTGPHAELSAALAGAGIALLPEAVTRRYIEKGRLVRVLDGYGLPLGTISAVFAANRQPAALRAFLDFLAAKAEESF